jgi:hypothetical protein
VTTPRTVQLHLSAYSVVGLYYMPSPLQATYMVNKARFTQGLEPITEPPSMQFPMTGVRPAAKKSTSKKDPAESL